jgi:hypothetical protein
MMRNDQSNQFVKWIFIFASLLSAVAVDVGGARAEDQNGDAIQIDQTKKKATKKTENQSSLEARHKDCLAFIERHGLSCDPWVTPTCGYDIGYARPLTCVAP